MMCHVCQWQPRTVAGKFKQLIRDQFSREQLAALAATATAAMLPADYSPDWRDRPL